MLPVNLHVCYAILEKAPYGIILADKDGTFLYMNPEFTNITGYAPEDTPNGSTWLSKAYPDPTYRQEVIRFWKEDVTHRGVDRQFTVTCRDGGVKIVVARGFGGEQFQERRQALDALLRPLAPADILHQAEQHLPPPKVQAAQA